ncbi:hypothetical protein [Aeoliella mucimassa]|uniref:Phytanoyl-CoA dioxygenase (PhyH) n=1 Tax=Aeoliella mucimassa TaxID=2527972 RepID=A0A518AWN4_9BACT|nr:hypothetical protein [Aeoliella mucimassa]QDU59145.1 hypothetical protein Pan181_53860 [Aeoliella mucimassa]
MIIESNIELLGTAAPFSQQIVRQELSQARTSIDEAMAAGPAHRAFIESLPDLWRTDPDVQIFSRLLYLKPGWYPLGPHYHFDWGGQNASDGSPVETIMVLHGEASQTEFILGPLEQSEPSAVEPRGHRRRPGRDQWDSQVAAGLASGSLKQWFLEPNQQIRFDSRTLHRARPAKTAGWRVLIRAIRGLTNQVADPGRFTTCRNGYIPITDEQRTRYAPYQDR